MTRSLRPLLATALIFLFAYLLAVLQHPAMFSTRVVGNFLTDNAFLGIAALHFMKQRNKNTRTRRTHWVPKRNGATIHIYL